MFVEDHRLKNQERFATRDEGLRKVAKDHKDFLKREDNRHTSKIEARERILLSMSVDLEQQKEMRMLRFMDVESNVERERKKKQEF